MEAWTLVFYKTVSGNNPVQNYIKNQDARAQECITDALILLREHGINLKAPYVKHIEGKMWELRIRAEAQHRIFYFTHTGRELILLHAFTKKTRAAPEKDKKTAEKRMKDFLKRS